MGPVDILWLFFFNDTATTEIYTLSLHDALPISPRNSSLVKEDRSAALTFLVEGSRSEEHTSELQSRQYLVCRLLLETKKMNVDGRIVNWHSGAERRYVYNSDHA